MLRFVSWLGGGYRACADDWVIGFAEYESAIVGEV